MSDLIERLRLNQGKIFGPTMQEAADEIERLQRENEELTQTVAELSEKMATAEQDVVGLLKAEYYRGYSDREQEIRDGIGAYGHPIEENINALKASTEPVAWRTFDGEGGYDLRNYEDNENYKEWYATYNPKFPHWCEPLYLAPPTAEALVEDFKRRCIEVLLKRVSERHGYDKYGDVEAIESLPLIQGEKE